MVDMQFILLTVIGTFILAAVVLIGSNMSTIVSIVSSITAHARAEGEARRAYRQRVYTMSSAAPVPDLDESDGSWRSPALDRTLEPDGSVYGNSVPALWEQLGTLSDDELLDILARVKNAQGEYKYADSRIAKFVGGRVEDRTNQVRDVRGSEPPPPKAQPMLRVRDNGMERLIAKYGDKHTA